LLVDMGADVDARASPTLKRWNSIMFAAANGNADCIAILTHANADLLDTHDSDGRTALQIAWDCDHIAAAEALEVAVEARRVRNKKQKAAEENKKNAYLRRLSTKRLLRQSSRFSLSAMDEPESLKPLQRLHRGFRRVSLAAGVLARMARAPRTDDGAPRVVELRRSRSDSLPRASAVATTALDSDPQNRSSRSALWSPEAGGGGGSLTA